MEKIFVYLYLYDMIGKLENVLFFGGLLVLSILSFYYELVLDECCLKKEEEIKRIKDIKSNLKKYIKVSVILTIIGLLLIVLSPRKYLFYSYLGYNVGKKIKIDEKLSPILDKSLKIINLELDKKLKELKEFKENK